MTDDKRPEEEEYVPTPEDFLFDEEETEEEKKKKHSQKLVFRFIGLGLALLLIMQVANIWLNLFSADSRELARTSEEIVSEHGHIADFKEAVVTIQGNGGRGTGFAISEDGYILTNHHVIHNRAPLAVVFPTGDIFHAEVLESKEELDVALLKIEAEEVPYLPIRQEDAIEKEKIYVIGSPLSQTQIVNEGEVLNDEEPYQVLKISNAIFPGHSGSPVLSEQGEVVGVVYARSVPSIGSQEEGHGLAIPIEIIVDEMAELARLLERNIE
ncbi:hypothetical protein JCM9140_423 [Halalkalibacter wakoensis JCM 9140]|uniref:Serine protease n=1 Tax=Halalkalibacter wakoensis JCM 9140 TaxID=1236970 RepID=W4PXU3_9BACI|nr:serine protease [Halalkalibacter wakoensis]GAE24490.1 hypothetical protein JCM9140_423 [Halalkalibacter wakoensis JCM 9140]